jgi:chemotaxis signal transduction protein
MAEYSNKRMAAYLLGETLCLSPTVNIDAVTQSPDNYRIIPGTKPYFLGNSRIGRDLVSYYHLSTFLGLPARDGEQEKYDLPTTLVIRDPLSRSTMGIITDGVIGFIPVPELRDAENSEVSLPSKLAPFCNGVVTHRDAQLALINLDSIVCDPSFRNVELSS